MSFAGFLKLVFGVSVALVLYIYIVYPILLFALAVLQQAWSDMRFALMRRGRRHCSETEPPPTVSLIFSAYNEEAMIPSKMRNCAELRYPAGYLEILVGCDGCTDSTAELARASGIPDLRVYESPQRRGKPAMLNYLAPLARGEILVFCDANTMLEPDALILLLRRFSDPDVGCVCGELRLVPSARGPSTEGFYWRYEVVLKFLESRLNMLVGANGAIYAIRKELFTPLPPQGIIDDFLQAMQVRAQGRAVVYDPQAVAIEESAGSIREEFQRRVRIGAGNLHALRFTWRMLLPSAGTVAFSYWSHKMLRWLSPFALVAAFLSALFLAADPSYAVWAVLGALVGGMALTGYHQERRNIHRPTFSIPYYFLSMNLALLLGFVRFATGRQGVIWRPTMRDTTSVEQP